VDIMSRHFCTALCIKRGTEIGSKRKMSRAPPRMLRVRNEESQTIRVEVEALDPHGPGVFKWIETEGTRVSETERAKGRDGLGARTRTRACVTARARSTRVFRCQPAVCPG